MFLGSKAANAQLIPDTTVGTEITPFDPNNSIIGGGTTIEQNLFHSFESFNIAPGKGVFFLAPNDVNHIFSRVTGSASSQIDGVLGTFGSDADLFFINPNGIVFGPGASLAVQGSFIATTADGVQLGNSGQFNAAVPASDSLLAINPSAFFFSDLTQPGDIKTNQAGLEVPNGEALVLLGGDITIDGGGLIADGGRLELGAIASTGDIPFSATNQSLSVPDTAQRSDIQIINNAIIGFLNTTNGQTASVRIYTNDLGIRDNSFIITGISPGTNLGNISTGNIQVNAARDIILSNNAVLATTIAGKGQVGTIDIVAENLSILDNSSIGHVIDGEGSTGNIVIDVQDQVVIDDSDISDTGFSTTAIFTSLNSNAIGKTGDISLSAGNLAIRNGFVSTSFFGSGTAGDIVVDIEDEVILENGIIGSSIFPEAQGDGGDISIFANRLEIFDDSSINTDTRGIGNAGDIKVIVQGGIILTGNEAVGSSISSEIETSGIGNSGKIEISATSLEVFNGSTITNAVLGRGNAGNITINTSDFVVLDGVRNDPNGNFPSSTFSFVDEGAIGNGGDIEIVTGRLQVTNRGEINVSMLGQGRAGNIIINATDDIRLNNGLILAESFSDSPAGSITIRADSLVLDSISLLSTATKSVDGGNINLILDDLLLLRDRSDIRAQAGTLGGGGNGGNIDINSSFIIAIPIENSDIQANAFEGDGGQVDIAARGVFGIEPRPTLTPLSDITASSENSVEGIVTVNALDTSFIQDNLATLPDQFINPNSLILNSCVDHSQTEAGSFTITGDNLSESPDTQTAGQYPTGSVQSLSITENVSGQPNDTIVEPSAIYRTTDGRLVMAKIC
ncbi:MAG: filamentous hemagglutinin N-terminal domain-containing protein [Leptolyngbya sp. SIO3F4]|nr:filamentous hemagglutinin N-terminal domain-containing protein [Leptolyngbya sp. SIO3F4]